MVGWHRPPRTQDYSAPLAQAIARHSLEPLEIRVIRWEVDNLDEGANIHVELRYRGLPPYVLQALRLEELMDRVEIFTIDTAETTL